MTPGVLVPVLFLTYPFLSNSLIIYLNKESHGGARARACAAAAAWRVWQPFALANDAAAEAVESEGEVRDVEV